MLKFIKGLFGQSDSPSGQASSNAATAPLSDYQLLDITGDYQSKLAQLISGSALDIGKRRENNEDALLSINGTLGIDSSSQTFGLYAVADGMGGHKNGEVASEAALRALGSHVMDKLYAPLFGIDPHPAEESLREIMEAGVHAGHKAIQRAAPGGGCTITAALVLGTQLTIAHLGDSRAYAIYSDGRIQTLTRDHTLVQRLQEMGQITPEEAAVHPQRSVLYRALGQGEEIEIDLSNHSLPTSGYLLICSDGLWGVVDDDTIAHIVNSTASPHLACQHLIEAANSAGGPDNIAVIVVRLIN